MKGNWIWLTICLFTGGAETMDSIGLWQNCLFNSVGSSVRLVGIVIEL